MRFCTLIALGAFRTSPTPSLYVEVGEPSLQHRRLKLSMNYFLKIKSLPENPSFEPITNSGLFEKTQTAPPFGTRILPHILEAYIDPTSIDNQYEHNPRPWVPNNNLFDTLLSSFKKRLDEWNVTKPYYTKSMVWHKHSNPNPIDRISISLKVYLNTKPSH